MADNPPPAPGIAIGSVEQEAEIFSGVVNGRTYQRIIWSITFTGAGAGTASLFAEAENIGLLDAVIQAGTYTWSNPAAATALGLVVEIDPFDMFVGPLDVGDTSNFLEVTVDWDGTAPADFDFGANNQIELTLTIGFNYIPA